MRKYDSSISKSARKPNSLVPAWSLIKELRDIDLHSLSGANPSSGSEQTKVVVTARAMGTPAVKCNK